MFSWTQLLIPKYLEIIFALGRGERELDSFVPGKQRPWVRIAMTQIWDPVTFLDGRRLGEY
jgi:hypothetical protein